jgi:hypothetical protein
MWQLNLPAYNFNIKKKEDKYFIFDKLRRKYIKLNPEEWVRQNFIQYLIEEKSFPSSRIAVEHQIIINGLKKRCDAVYFNEYSEPEIIFEFKSPEIKIDLSVMDQALNYQFQLQTRYIILSNGIEHYFLYYDTGDKTIKSYNFIPSFTDFLLRKAKM